MNRKDYHYFEQAAKLSEYSTFKKHHLGCVITYGNKVISTGVNKDKTDPLQRTYNQERNIPDSSPHKIHAEVDAIKHIIDLDIDWNHISLYVCRKRKDGHFGLARPCRSCMRLIKDLGIKHIYYTTDDGYAYEKIK